MSGASVILTGVPSETDATAAVVRDAFDLHYGPIVAWTDRLLLDTDLAHETVTAAFATLLRLDKSPEDARPAVYAHVVHTVLEHWRHEGDHPVRSTHAVAPNPNSGRTARSLGRLLPERLREVFLLRWYAALSIQDIVAVTSHNTRSVQRDLAEAKRALSKSVGVVTDEELEEFFVAERTVLRPVPAGPDRWEQIAHQAQQRERSWFWPIAAVIAVLALVVSFWSLGQNPFGGSGVDAGNPVGPASQSAQGGTDGPDRATSGPQSPQAVPPTFVPWSLSNAGSGTVYSLGSISCTAEEVCPTLLRSTDNGSSWTAVHSFTDTDTASVTSDEVPRIQPAGAVTGVRFADPRNGFAFGGDLWRTRDGGRTFTAMRRPGASDTVLDVAISDGQIIVLSADSCSQGRCLGPLRISRAKVGDSGIGESLTVMALAEDRPIDAAELVVSGGKIFVQPYRVDGNLDPPWRLDGGALLPMKPTTGCLNDPLQSLTATSRGRPTLFALCGGALRGNQTGYRVVRSTDQGRTWAPTSDTLLELPRVGRLSLAAIDDMHLVVGTGGPRKVSGPTRVVSPSRLLQVSQDRGAGWKVVRDPRPPPQGMDRVEATPGGEVYALTRTTAAFWRSPDDGKTWGLVDPTRPPPSSSSSAPSSAVLPRG